MKFTKLIAVLSIVLLLSCGKDYSSDIQDLRDLITQQSELISQLQKGMTITKFTEDESGYTLVFSDGKSVTVKNSTAPVIKIGDNLNWFINGADTGVSSQGGNGSDGSNGKDGIDGSHGSDGKDGVSPKIEIINGYWAINGVSTGVRANAVDGINGKDGANGKDGKYIVSSVLTGNSIVFNFSDGSTIESKMVTKRYVASWGDSLTSGGGSVHSFTAILKGLVNDSSFDFYNFGEGGENSILIAGRQGGIPMYLNTNVTLPADNTPVVIGTKDRPNLHSTWNDQPVTPLLRSGNTGHITINNCVIDGVSVVLRWTGSNANDANGTYTVERVGKSERPSTLKAGSILYTSSMRQYRNAYANIFFVGQNGGYSSNEDLVAQYKAMVSFSPTNNYLVIGLATGTAESRKDLEKLMTKEFGARYVNLRAYMSSNAIYDAGLTPTAKDQEAMEKGSVPPALMADAIHFNNTGYKVIGEHLYKKFTYLGIF